MQRKNHSDVEQSESQTSIASPASAAVTTASTVSTSAGGTASYILSITASITPTSSGAVLIVHPRHDLGFAIDDRLKLFANCELLQKQFCLLIVLKSHLCRQVCKKLLNIFFYNSKRHRLQSPFSSNLIETQPNNSFDVGYFLKLKRDNEKSKVCVITTRGNDQTKSTKVTAFMSCDHFVGTNYSICMICFLAIQCLNTTKD